MTLYDHELNVITAMIRRTQHQCPAMSFEDILNDIATELDVRIEFPSEVEA